MKLPKYLTALTGASILGFAISANAVDFATFISTNVPAIPPAEQDLDDDPDGDGITSGVEFLIDGMNPGIADNGLMPEAVVSGNTLTYTVTKRAGITGIIANIQVLDIFGNNWTTPETVTENATTLEATQAIVDYGSASAIARVTVEEAPSSNNPIAAAYPEEFITYYEWTEEEFDWDTEYDVTFFGAIADGNYANSTGTDNWNAFNAAMQVAAGDAQTSGEAKIVRIPAGVYYIGESLLIPPGVVLRGADPGQGADKAVDKTNQPSGANPSFDPPSKLVFPKVPVVTSGAGPDVAGGPGVGYKRIYSDALAQWDAADTDPLDPSAHSRIGLVNLDINRAAIILDTPERTPIKDGGNWSGKGDATILTPFTTDSVGQYFIVYGIKSNNTAVADGSDGVNSGIPKSNQDDWQRNPWRFNANIRVMSGGYALIANNQINYTSSLNTWAWGRPDDSPVFLDDSYEQEGYRVKADNNQWYPLNGAGKATFRHTNQYGISLNGLYFMAKAGKGGAPADPWGNENGWYASATSAPWLFCPGHHVKDNWVYVFYGAKTEASGAGLRYLRNCLRDASRKTAFYQAAGDKKPSNGSAFLSRGVLMAGSDVVSNDNDIITTKHNIGNPQTGSVTGFVSNDGEGLMIDNTSSNVYGWQADNNKVNANIFIFKTKGINEAFITNNDWGTTAPSISSRGNPIWIDSNPNNVDTYPLDNSIIAANVNLPGTVIFKGTAGENNKVLDNAAISTEETRLTIGTEYEISGNTNLNIIFQPQVN